MDDMICTDCGWEVSSDDNFCRSCGTAFTRSFDEDRPSSMYRGDVCSCGGDSLLSRLRQELAQASSGRPVARLYTDRHGHIEVDINVLGGTFRIQRNDRKESVHDCDMYVYLNRLRNRRK